MPRIEQALQSEEDLAEAALAGTAGDAPGARARKEDSYLTTPDNVSEAKARIAGAPGFKSQALLCGPDRRSRILATSRPPWRRLGCTLSTFPRRDQVLVGTAWLVGPDLMVTAAHNVCDGGYGGRAKRVKVQVGQNGAATRGDACDAEIAWLPDLWKFGENSDHDIAILRLSKRVGEARGWFDVRATPPAHLAQQKVFVCGYPAQDDKFGELWLGSDIVKVATQTRIYYGAQTTPGQSGAPVWIEEKLPGEDRSRSVVVGLHTTGAKNRGGGHARDYNFGPRVRPALVRQIKLLSA